jgi:hypothetical protein
MQVFRLVQPGVVDRVIAFEELPKDLVEGIQTREPAGLPRNWKEFAPKFYVLDYLSINNDIQRWEKIKSHVRRSVSPGVRLMDKLEDMAMPMAPNAKDALDLEPENVPVIPLPVEEKALAGKKKGAA